MYIYVLCTLSQFRDYCLIMCVARRMDLGFKNQIFKIFEWKTLHIFMFYWFLSKNKIKIILKKSDYATVYNYLY